MLTAFYFKKPRTKKMGKYGEGNASITMDKIFERLKYIHISGKLLQKFGLNDVYLH